MSEKEEDESGDEGCVAILFVIVPCTAGVWLLYGPDLGLLSVPLWILVYGLMRKIL